MYLFGIECLYIISREKKTLYMENELEGRNEVTFHFILDLHRAFIDITGTS